MNKKLKTLLTAGLLTIGMAANACQLTAWDSSTGAAAGGPDDANVIARYAGLCAMDGKAGTVLNTGNNPSGGPSAEPNMIARFYFLATGSSDTITIFQAYSDLAATTPIYTVTYDGTNVTVTPNDGGADTAVQAVAATNWHSVEISWTANGTIDLWVDTDATTDAAAADAGASTNAASVIRAVRLGVASGGTNYANILFDAYESRRSSAIGRLLPGDANTDGAVDLGDVITILNEFLQIATATGTPDTNEDGTVDLGDVISALNIFLGI